MGTFVDIFFAVRLLLELLRALAFALGALNVPAWVLDAPLYVAGIVFSAAVGHLVVEYGVKPLIRWLKRILSREDRPENSNENHGENPDEIRRFQRKVGRLEGTESVLREELERERREKGRLEAELREARRPWWRRVSGK